MTLSCYSINDSTYYYRENSLFKVIKMSCRKYNASCQSVREFKEFCRLAPTPPALVKIIYSIWHEDMEKH